MTFAAPTLYDRALQAFRELVRAEMPRLTYLGLYEYAIQKTDGVTVDATPTADIPLPGLVGVPLRSSTLGEVVKPTIGSRCLVAFVNGDPTRPVCVGCDPTPEKATIDATSKIGIGVAAGSGKGAARIGDGCGALAITTSGGNVVDVKYNGVSVGIIGTVIKIEGGSSKVTVG